MTRILTLRKEAGLTQMLLAQAVGVSRSTVAMWESGKSAPTSEKIPILADKLGCSIDDLFRAPQASADGAAQAN